MIWGPKVENGISGRGNFQKNGKTAHFTWYIHYDFIFHHNFVLLKKAVAAFSIFQVVRYGIYNTLTSKM